MGSGFNAVGVALRAAVGAKPNLIVGAWLSIACGFEDGTNGAFASGKVVGVASSTGTGVDAGFRSEPFIDVVVWGETSVVLTAFARLRLFTITVEGTVVRRITTETPRIT